MSTEPIRAERDERCMDASRANETRRSMLARAGIAAGTLGLLGLAQPARAATTRFDDTVEVVPPAGAAALKLVCSGNVPYSVVTGGALNLDNTGSTGAGAVLYSNRGADALGRLLMVNQANPGQSPARRADPERRHGAHRLDLPRPRRRCRGPDRRGGRHRLHQRAGHHPRRARSGDRQGHREDHARQAARGRTPTPPPSRSRSRELEPRARASTSATTRTTPRPATSCTSATAARAPTVCG